MGFAEKLDHRSRAEGSPAPDACDSWNRRALTPLFSCSFIELAIHDITAPPAQAEATVYERARYAG
jgi:hypothetical protein